MQVKKFEAPTMAEALKLIKAELGPEAIILTTKQNRKGFGLLSKASVEVTAAISEKALSKKKVTDRLLPQTQKEVFEKLPASAQAEVYDNFGDYVVNRKIENVQRKNSTTFQSNIPVQQQPKIQVPIQNQSTQASDGYNRGSARSINPLIPQAPIQSTQINRNEPKRYVDIEDEEHSTNYSSNRPRLDTSSMNQIERPRQTVNVDGREVLTARELALQEDVKKLKSMIEEIKTEQTALNDTKVAESSSTDLFEEFQHLLRNGIDKRYASKLIKQVSFDLEGIDRNNHEKIYDTLAIEIMNQVKVDDPFDFNTKNHNMEHGKNKAIVALVGPTGVGKTTTLAKLASHAILHKNLKVGLINVDSYKVAAVDQMATYAKILNVPFRQASNPVELDRALAEFKPLDLILIDTSGRSQKDAENLAQMHSLLKSIPQLKSMLIMSATTRDQELYDIVNRFKMFEPSGLIFSKLDESATFGCIYNVALKTNLPLTYFTVGQRVPEDIELASRERLAALLLDL